MSETKKPQVITDQGPIHIMVVKTIEINGEKIELPVRVYPTGGKPEKQYVK